jgi:NAD(P)-dependent dehydrogenase (short-subunit alcohol dehydrogenase family)
MASILTRIFAEKQCLHCTDCLKAVSRTELLVTAPSGVHQLTLLHEERTWLSAALFQALMVVPQASKLKHGVSIVADLTKPDDVAGVIPEAIEKLGGLDILINKCDLCFAMFLFLVRHM